MKNKFRNKQMVLQFDSMVTAYTQRKGILFNPDGSRNTFNGFANNFWAGYNGMCVGLYDYSISTRRNTLAYATYHAGEMCAEAEE